ncbi:hypothetical protein CMV_010592 [Castanea mollissima]|uniref:Protein kinase domain-containing protein n=1 Tax=Castanea mollissima TaxID=60419 RepID=A0A8J4W0M5_9ROSI|nr:hypothetical protein CMV_010592 [Castanea mollissima]
MDCFKCGAKRPLVCCTRGRGRREYDARQTYASMLSTFSMKTGSSKHRNLAQEILKLGHARISAQVFTFYDLAAATDNFNPDCLVGEGGFGRVYKGYIGNTDQVVAVKQLDRKGLQGSREFFAEVLMLSLVEHPNLVDLIGYCADGDQRILVYEFMANGSLENHLLGRRAIDTARMTEEQNLITWAQPLFRDRKKFTLMADPLLKGNYPVKGLYQALAVAAMCLQEEADTRPLMGDVVTAIEHLATPRDDGKVASDLSKSSGAHAGSVREESGNRGREL